MILNEGQYQIGDLVFGSGTPIIVSSFEPGGYEVTVHDRNRDRTDEISFGSDTYTPAPILFELSVIDNFDIRRGVDFSIDGWERGVEILQRLSKEWRADEVRGVWNSHKALIYKKNGPQKVIFGRPRKITAFKTRKGNEFIPVVAEFMPSDTYAYSFDIFSETVGAGGSAAIKTRGGLGQVWTTIYIEGPVASPKVDFGAWEVELDHEVAAGDIVEINPCPWQRRVVDTNSQTLSAKLIGDSAYLDEMKVPPRSDTEFIFTGTGTNSSTSCTVAWRETYLNY